MRNAEITRKTKETEISVMLDLDGSGKAYIKTGIGFFDHMLTALCVHGGFRSTVITPLRTLVSFSAELLKKQSAI